ncbi:hypothetical protein DPEC_G00239450 [Dallia pectoralis]|uniref:Uncharacterized protein n=1 Tax=Dallia pectoralis TaxID=75939 RepID=A0ACC2FZ63_DALPE|nr:hypothetical protein DPEC_G00239450 [Dallia pectoralis]
MLMSTYIMLMSSYIMLMSSRVCFARHFHPLSKFIFKRSKVVWRRGSVIETEPDGLKSLSHTLYQPSEVSSGPTSSYSQFSIQRLLNTQETAMFVAGPRLAGQRGNTRDRQSLEKLPSPADLMGRKKKGGTWGAVVGSQAVQPSAVLQHIGDLHRRQTSIDQLKQGRWWGSKPRCTAKERTQQPSLDRGLPQTQLDPNLSFSPTTVGMEDECINSLSPTLTQPDTQQQGLFGGFEQASYLAPGGNPMMSFVLATASRQPTGGWRGSRLSHDEFWGIWHNPEE